MRKTILQSKVGHFNDETVKFSSRVWISVERQWATGVTEETIKVH